MGNTKKYLDLNRFLNIIETNNEYLKGHLVRVCSLAVKLAEIMSLSKKEIEIIKCGAILHDVGKIKIDNSILNKTCSLNDIEYDIIKKHPIYGFQILKEYVNNKEILNIIKFHHERWDGNGYPFKLKGKKIPLKARIVSIIDAFDAMTSFRPYRSTPLSIEEALEEIRNNAGIQFDKDIAIEFYNKADQILKGHDEWLPLFINNLLNDLEKISG